MPNYLILADGSKLEKRCSNCTGSHLGLSEKQCSGCFNPTNWRNKFKPKKKYQRFLYVSKM